VRTLLIDIGNTAIKWGFSNPKPIRLLGRENYRKLLPEACILANWQTLPRPKNVFVSNVATHSTGEKMKALIKKCWDIDATFIHENQTCEGVKPLITHGILGVDRWLGLLALRQIEQQPFAMVGCGTAITLDVCQNGTHLGGLITPGIELMRLALEKFTAGCRLNLDTNDSDNLLAFDTDGAMRAGTLQMAAAFIETTVGKIEEKLDLPLKIFIAGGDVSRLIPRFQFAQRFIEMPSVVLSGLALFEDNGCSHSN
jgi:type III pantothenate kinase